MNVDGVGTTNLSGQLRIDRPLGEDAKKLLQSMIEHGYEEFLAARGRGAQEDPRRSPCHRAGPRLDRHRREDNGLVDHLGLFDDAVKAAATRAKIEGDYEVERIEPELSWAESLALQIKVWFAKNFVGDVVSRNPLLKVAREPRARAARARALVAHECARPSLRLLLLRRPLSRARADPGAFTTFNDV